MTASATVEAVLHAGPAALTAARAAAHAGTVTLERADGVRIDASSPLRILAIAAFGMQTLTVRATGLDSDSAVADIVEILRAG